MAEFLGNTKNADSCCDFRYSKSGYFISSCDIKSTSKRIKSGESLLTFIPLEVKYLTALLTN